MDLPCFSLIGFGANSLKIKYKSFKSPQQPKIVGQGGMMEAIREGNEEKKLEGMLREAQTKLLEKVEQTLLEEQFLRFKEEAKKERLEMKLKKRAEEAKEWELKIKEQLKKSFLIDLLTGFLGGLSFLLWQINKPWWALCLGILSLATLWLKAKIIEIPHTVGDRGKVRLTFALGCWCLIVFLVAEGILSLPIFKDTSFLIKIISFFGVASLVVGISWKIFTFNVPEWTGINVFNSFTGKQTTFLPGFYFKFPWESIKQGSIHSLKSTKEDTQKRNYPTGSGTVLTAEIMVQFAPDPFNLITFEGIDNRIITQGLMEHVSSILLAYIAVEGRTAKGIRANIGDLHEKVREELGIEEGEKRTLEDPKKASPSTRSQNPIEKAYGILIIIAKLSDLNFEENYQKVLTSNMAMKQIQAMADAICLSAGEDMTKKEAWDQAMIVSGKAEGHIIKTIGGGQAVPLLNIGGGTKP